MSRQKVDLWQLIVLKNNCNLLIVRFVLCYECKYSCALDLQYNAKTIYANHKVLFYELHKN